MGERVDFFGDKTWQTWCHLAQNLMRIPKPSRSIGKATRVGRKMAKTIAATRAHAPPAACVAYCLTMKL